MRKGSLMFLFIVERLSTMQSCRAIRREIQQQSRRAGHYESQHYPVSGHTEMVTPPTSGKKRINELSAPVLLINKASRRNLDPTASIPPITRFPVRDVVPTCTIHALPITTPRNVNIARILLARSAAKASRRVSAHSVGVPRRHAFPSQYIRPRLG